MDISKQILIFDGLDRTGKSSIIENIIPELETKGKKVLLLHLTSPVEFHKLFLQPLDISMSAANFVYQWTKFDTTFGIIEKYIQADTNNIVILDRSPFSEPIWVKFFKRAYTITSNSQLNIFLKRWQHLCNEMLFVDLNVCTETLIERILESECDTKFYLNAFTNFTNSDEGDIGSKLAYSITEVKNDFVNLHIKLRQFGITVNSYPNNTTDERDKNILSILAAISE